ncbi:hypothetical protein MMC17_003858 [Xylographa soralifera]|nr:hypothetical protein [Xylographa soralifera]
MARSEGENTHVTTVGPASHIERFFTSYPDLDYNPLHSSAAEYQRMRRIYGWKRDDLEGQGNKAWAAYRVALVKEFVRLFRTDEHDLLAWQTLCKFAGIRGSSTGVISATCENCFKHFILVDLVDAYRRGDEAAQVFPTEEALQEYTKRTASYFPYGNPKAGNLLKTLLRKQRKDMAGNPINFPLHPPPANPGKRADFKSAKIKDAPSSTKRREARITKKNRMTAEACETGESNVSVDFKPE